MRAFLRRVFSLNDPGWGRNSSQGSGQGSNQPQNDRDDGGRDERRSRRPDSPPDLDELWRDFNRKLNQVFRGGRGQGPRGPSSAGPSMPTPSFGKGGLGALAAVLLALWLGSGIYILPEGHVAAILQFGEFRQLNESPGLSWRMPYPVQQAELVNTQQLRQAEVGYRGNVKNKVLKEALMLSQDQSIVDLQIAVQYRISDARSYLFNNQLSGGPDNLIRQAAETATREVVGTKTIDQVLYEEKEAVAKAARQQTQNILNRYKVGITIVDLNVQQAQPPEQVQAAFEDANKAAQDRERLINEGMAYANDVIPKARGAAARLMQEAEGYRQSTIATAEGDASRFKQVLVEYSKAPQVTRDRMYLEVMQQVFANNAKVLVDSKAGGNLLYLPLDKLIQQSGTDSSAGAANKTTNGELSSQSPAPAVPRVGSEESRGRGSARMRERESGR
ncbi:MAG: FtsH protease activity modulator HflK [Betaproteobacteria bacterium]